MPEARIILGQCATYLASQPKSNAAYIGINKALEDVRQKPLYPVPIHLRNAPTKLMKELNYGKEYKYAHDYKGNFADQSYLPDEMKNAQYYFPTENGLEKPLKERLKTLWQGKKKY
jgi:putative ATPase